MKVRVQVTSGTLTEGEYVEGTTTGYTRTGRVAFTSTWAGTYDGARLDTHDGEETYHYFKGGHINGLAQGAHGFPTSQMEA